MRGCCFNWSSKEFELNGGKVDVLWNGLTITPARQETMLMSPAYIANAQVIVVRNRMVSLPSPFSAM